MDKHKQILHTYNHRVNTCPTPLPCPTCCHEGVNTFLLPKLFKKHFKTAHPNLHNTCYWCASHTWPSRDKTRHALHLRDCFNQLFHTIKMNLLFANGRAKVRKTQPCADSPRMALYHFQKSLSMKGSSYPCLRCQHPLLAHEMERHFKESHAPFDPTVACVWCNGAVTWPRGQKNQNLEHLKQCSQSFFEKDCDEESWANLFIMEEPPYSTEKVLLDSLRIQKPLFMGPSLVGNMLGRKRISLPEEAYGPVLESIDFDVFPAYRITNSIVFEKVIQDARFYTDLYLQWNGQSDGVTWFHVMLSGVAFEPFMKAVQKWGSEKLFSLPYWCWCDGGRYKEDLLKWHRHMILVVRHKKDFKNHCWTKLSKIVHSEKMKKELQSKKGVWIPRHYSMGRFDPIRSWMHLVNVMAYVSKCTSVCRYSFKDFARCQRKRRINNSTLNNKTRNNSSIQPGYHHFCIGSDWHPLTKLCLACIAGEEQHVALLNQMHRSRTQKTLKEFCFRWPSNPPGSWYANVGDLSKHFHQVLPVEKTWRPWKIVSGKNKTMVEKEGSFAFFYLLDGKLLLFQRDMSLQYLSDQAWWYLQATGDHGKNNRNLFYDVVADSRWKLSRTQQKNLNDLEDCMDEIKEQYRKKIKEVKAQYKADLDKALTQRDAEWNEKLQTLKREIALLIKRLPAVRSHSNSGHSMMHP